MNRKTPKFSTEVIKGTCPHCGRKKPGRQVRVDPDFNPRALKAARVYWDMTQQELGDKVGVGPKTIASWERGTVPPQKTLTAMEEILQGKFVKTR